MAFTPTHCCAIMHRFKFMQKLSCVSRVLSLVHNNRNFSCISSSNNTETISRNNHWIRGVSVQSHCAPSPILTQLQSYHNFSRGYCSTFHDEAVSIPTEQADFHSGVVANINKQISENNYGRLFAVIHMAGKQFKVTSEDLVLILANKQFPDVGERIVLNKVLLVAGKDFSMVGRPLLENVRVEATVIEKTLSHPKIWFRYRRRKNWQKTRLIQEFRTILRINSIEVESEVD